MVTRDILTNKRVWLYGVLSALLLLLVLVEPCDFDSAIEKSFGIDLLKEGKLPYLGTFDQNFPGVVYIHAAAIAVFGHSDLEVRLFDVLLQLLFFFFLLRLWSRWLSIEVSALAALLYILYYVSGGPTLFGKRDAYVMMSVLIAWWILLNGDRSSILRIVIAGVVAGFSVWLRPTSLLFLAILAAFVCLDENLRPKAWARALLFFIAGLIPLGLDLWRYSRIEGGLLAFYDATIRFNLDVYIGLGTSSSLTWELVRTGLMIPLAVFALWNRRRSTQLERPPTRLELWIYLSLVISALFIVVLMRKYIRYHFAPFFMVITPLTALGVYDVIERFRTPSMRRFALCLICVLCSFVGYNPKGPFGFLRGLFLGADPVEAAYELRFPDSLAGARVERSARNYLERNTSSRDTIEIASFDPRLRSHLDRHFAGNWAVLYPLALHPAGKPYTDYQKAWRQSYLDSLISEKPRYLVLSHGPSFWYLKDVYKDFLRGLPSFDSILTTSYRRDTLIGGFEIFKRR